MKNILLTKKQAKTFREDISELLTKIDLGIKHYVANNHNEAIKNVSIKIEFKDSPVVIDYVKYLLINDYGWEGAILTRDNQEKLIHVYLPW